MMRLSRENVLIGTFSHPENHSLRRT